MAAPASGPRAFVEKEWNASDVKPSKLLLSSPFNGGAESYKYWADRVKDHFKEKNRDYEFVFREIEAQKVPVMKANMSNAVIGDSTRQVLVDWSWITSHLWTFIGKHVTQTTYTRRTTLTGGEEDNGVELWRALFVENEGGAEQVLIGGLN